MPKVSFILPAYKRRFLQEAIASILAQTYQDFELIVVDDCSPEGLEEVVSLFHDKRLAYHRNEKNIGGRDLVAAWNKALSYATGEWVVCAGDDDVYLPEFAAELVSLTGKYPKTDAFHCRIVYIDGDGKVTKVGAPRAEFESCIQMIDHSCVTRKDQRIPDFMYRRSKLMEYGGYAASPKAWYSDIMTAIGLSMEHGAVCCPRILMKWRQSGENISSRCDDVDVKIEAGCQFLEWMDALLRGLNPKDYDDQLTLDIIKRGVKKQTLSSMSYYLSMLDAKNATNVVRRSRLSDEDKIAFVRQFRRRGRLGFFFRIARIFGL